MVRPARALNLLSRAPQWAGRTAGDAWRIAAAMVTLNARKTAWRWRGRRARCPCQNPGDSGRAFETHCDAVMLWPRPGRLRHVCPALRVVSGRYVCGLDTARVRPYWGRAVVFFAGSVLALAGVAATGVFVGLRLTGVREVQWMDVAWPARWAKVRRARSDYFSAQSLQALSSGNLALARLALSSAVETDRSNYDAALLLAMLGSISPQRQLADASFQWLLAAHPAQAKRSAVMFHDALLAQGRTHELADFALWMAVHDPGSTSIWTRSLLSALRLGGNAATFARAHGPELRQLPRPARSLIAVEILLEQGHRETARLALQRPIAPGDPVYTVLQVQQLLRVGDAAAATVVKNALLRPDNSFYPLALQYWIEKQHGNDMFARLCFTALLTRTLSDEELDWATALLIRAPDARSYQLLDARVRRQGTFSQQAAAGMWAAAVVCGDGAAESCWAGVLQQQARISVPAGFAFNFDTLSPQREGSVPSVLNRVTLPRETIDALLSRVAVGK